MCLSAKANIALKKFDSAKSGIEDAIRLFPDFAGAHETLIEILEPRLRELPRADRPSIMAHADET